MYSILSYQALRAIDHPREGVSVDINHGRGDYPRGQVISDEEWGDMGSLLSSRRPSGAKACDRPYRLVNHRFHTLPLGIGGLPDGHR